MRTVTGIFVLAMLIGSSSFIEAHNHRKKDNDAKDLARTAFIKDKVIFIRLTPIQHQKVKLRRRGPVVIVLRPRQILAIRKALKKNGYKPKAWPKILLVVRAKEIKLKKITGVKGRYIIRLVKQFKKRNPSDRGTK